MLIKTKCSLQLTLLLFPVIPRRYMESFFKYPVEGPLAFKTGIQINIRNGLPGMNEKVAGKIKAYFI